MCIRDSPLNDRKKGVRSPWNRGVMGGNIAILREWNLLFGDREPGKVRKKTPIGCFFCSFCGNILFLSAALKSSLSDRFYRGGIIIGTPGLEPPSEDQGPGKIEDYDINDDQSQRVKEINNLLADERQVNQEKQRDGGDERKKPGKCNLAGHGVLQFGIDDSQQGNA